MLVELGLVEQRYKAVSEVLDGASVVDVARRNGVARQTAHDWLRRYAGGGMAALADRSSRPASCPHQMAAAVEARIVELRRANPRWGPRTILHRLAREGVDPLPGRSAVYRALVRHGLVDATRRRRRRADYRRWERSRAMELWQMDVVGRFHLGDGTEVSVITGIDDHSRFCVCARIVLRATARPVCDALAHAMRTHSVPEQILTDNAKVFTARFAKGPGPVLFDRICADNGIRHLLTAPYSPTTTGKVERFHKTLRAGFLGPNDSRFATLAEAQEALDAWVEHYNTERPHQSLGMATPAERFALAAGRHELVDAEGERQDGPAARQPRPGGVMRWVDRQGHISLGGFGYRAGRVFTGEPVEVVCHQGLVEIVYKGTVIATHAQRRRRHDDGVDTTRRAVTLRRARPSTAGATVTRLADASGTISFAGTSYRAGRRFARQSIDVAVVGASVQLSFQGEVIRVHALRHDRAKEHGAYATPNGRPRRPKTA